MANLPAAAALPQLHDSSPMPIVAPPDETTFGGTITPVAAGDATDLFAKLNSGATAGNQILSCQPGAGNAYSRTDWQMTASQTRTSWVYIQPANLYQAGGLDEAVPWQYRATRYDVAKMVHINGTTAAGGTVFRFGTHGQTGERNEQRYHRYTGCFLNHRIADRLQTYSHANYMMNMQCDLLLFDRCIFGREFENFQGQASMYALCIDVAFVGCTFLQNTQPPGGGNERQVFLGHNRLRRILFENCHFEPGGQSFYLEASAGDFGIPSGETFTRTCDHITMRGCQIGDSNINPKFNHNDRPGLGVFGYNRPGFLSTTVTSTGGTTTIDVASATGITTGDVIVIDEGLPTEEARNVIGVGGTTLTITSRGELDAWNGKACNLYHNFILRQFSKAIVEFKTGSNIEVVDTVVSNQYDNPGDGGQIMRLTPSRGNNLDFARTDDMRFERVLLNNASKEVQLIAAMKQNNPVPPAWRGSTPSGLRRCLFRSVVFSNLHKNSQNAIEYFYTEYAKHWLNDNRSQDIWFDHVVFYTQASLRQAASFRLQGGGSAPSVIVDDPVHDRMEWSNSIFEGAGSQALQKVDFNPYNGVNGDGVLTASTIAGGTFRYGDNVHVNSTETNADYIGTITNVANNAALLYADPDMYDFTLGGGSPAIGKGDGVLSANAGLVDPAAFLNAINSAFLGTPWGGAPPPPPPPPPPSTPMLLLFAQ